MNKPRHLLANNKKWAAAMKKANPTFFAELAKLQQPEYLWIGCADSRVPANEIVGLLPGEMFVHRNIANVVVHTDLNCLSVLQFAVDALKIKHIIVCGHYGCGGVKAAMENNDHGLLEAWLANIKDVQLLHRAELEETLTMGTRFDRLCEFNVIEQVTNVCRTNIVQQAWHRGQQLAVHGWIYEIGDGILQDLDVTINSLEQLPAYFRLT